MGFVFYKNTFRCSPLKLLPMTELKKDWITNGLMDFEYKKYVLLAYLKHVETNFDEAKLFPFMSELIDHYQDAKLIKEKKKTLASKMPKEISRLDLNKLELIYQRLDEDDNLFKNIEEIVDYAIPTMEKTLGKGKELHEWVASELKIDPIGIIPMYKDEGYVMMEVGGEKCTDIFQYQIKKFVMFNEISALCTDCWPFSPISATLKRMRVFCVSRPFVPTERC